MNTYLAQPPSPSPCPTAPPPRPPAPPHTPLARGLGFGTDQLTVREVGGFGSGGGGGVSDLAEAALGFNNYNIYMAP